MNRILSLAFAAAALISLSARADSTTPKVHPKVFNMITCWVSDSEDPVVTEINLDAVQADGNQFQTDEVTQDGEWTRAKTTDGGFMRYRIVASKGDHYTAEYQENGGGTLTTSAKIEFVIEKRAIRKDGRPVNIRVLRVLAVNSK